MKDLHEYDSLVNTIKMRNITSDRRNARVLRRLKGNDPNFTFLHVNTPLRHVCEHTCNPSAGDYGWLGYFIGNNTHLKEVFQCSSSLLQNDAMSTDHIALFWKGFNRNP